jgi:uncharacterized protein YeaC (DUF1315 family)
MRQSRSATAAQDNAHSLRGSKVMRKKQENKKQANSQATSIFEYKEKQTIIGMQGIHNFTTIF